MQKTHLVIIDPQFDFCDSKGALFVQGATEDMGRLAAFVSRVRDKLSMVHVTLDCHHLLDIAHPIFWLDEKGKNPNPFTIISASDVKKGVWRTAIPSWQKRALEYVQTLEKNARYPLCIWPPHCLIGSEGNKIIPDLFTELMVWEKEKLQTVNYVSKGSNPWTEHYSAVIADVPDPKDPTTQINTGFINILETADQILLAGEAGSHCLANTVRDVANNFSSEDYIQKLVLLEDATSPVTGFEKFQTDFIKEMTKRGMKVSKTTEWMV